MTLRVKEYEKRKKVFEEKVKEKTSSVSIIGNLRLLTFIVGVGITAYITYSTKNYVASSMIFFPCLLIFVYLIYLHNRSLKEKNYYELMMNINDEAIKRTDGRWKEFKDTGEEFRSEKHGYSGDLDIFGRSSLFQWINACSTYDGRRKLAYKLENPLKDAGSIEEVQKAVKELSEQLHWRQEFAAEGRRISNKTQNPGKLGEWAKSINNFYLNKNLIAICSVMPIVTMVLIIMSMALGLFSYKVALVAIAIQILALIPRHVERVWALETLYSYKENISVYEILLSSLQKIQFKSPHMQALQNTLLKGNHKATEGIRELQKISDKVSDRKNAFYIIINILFLWDYHCMIKMEKWKNKYGVEIEKWLEVIGEVEALSSIASIAYDNENWCIPTIKEEATVIKAKSMAHPLLGTTGVSNDISIEKNKNIILITGSNMSGKSTFERTIGVNLILSYIGAPVCAEEFSCSIMNVYTCMRISDNLEKSISSFYAEILRIKIIVEAAKKGEKIFFILDEIFKGTNSIDRHLGAKSLIKQLGKFNACGLVSTHDLELGDMEKEYNKIKNYHFQEYYEKGELKFDYKLRKGVSTTRNAMYIIKMAGIDIGNIDSL